MRLLRTVLTEAAGLVRDIAAAVTGPKCPRCGGPGPRPGTGRCIVCDVDCLLVTTTTEGNPTP